MPGNRREPFNHKFDAAYVGAFNCNSAWLRCSSLTLAPIGLCHKIVIAIGNSVENESFAVWELIRKSDNLRQTVCTLRQDNIRLRVWRAWSTYNATDRVAGFAAIANVYTAC